jgi:hypothetical protein
MSRHHATRSATSPAGGHADELPSIDLGTLSRVTGGAGMDMSAMLPMIMMMKQSSAGASAAAPAPAPAPAAPALPKILVDGVEQSASSVTSSGATFNATI